MEVAGPLGTPLGLAQRKRASPRGEARVGGASQDSAGFGAMEEGLISREGRNFNMLSRLVITFLPKSKRLLISWLQSPSGVILEPRKTKSDTVSHCFPIYLP